MFYIKTLFLIEYWHAFLLYKIKDNFYLNKKQTTNIFKFIHDSTSYFAISLLFKKQKK